MVCENYLHISSEGYTFALLTDQDDDMTVYKFVSLQKQPYPCVVITVYDGMMTLDALNYYSSCSLSQKSLDRPTGTVHMLKTALTYAFDKHPDIDDVELQDETFILIEGKPLITSRRLIQGEKGWYEEHLNAEPIGNTVRLLKFLRDPIKRTKINALVSKKETPWWTANNVIKVCEAIGCPPGILGTSWKIKRSTINDYDILYNVEQQTGGKLSNSRVKRIFKSSKGFPYDLILAAKYRGIPVVI